MSKEIKLLVLVHMCMSFPELPANSFTLGKTSIYIINPNKIYIREILEPEP